MQKPRHSENAWQNERGNCDVTGNKLSLFPFPEGWYFVVERRLVLKEQLIQKQWLGQDIVVWCDNRGAICVAQSVCPHLGSSLGPDAGGRVRDGQLVCPFHGFTYDVAGNYVATPFAPPPASTRLKVFETREILGLVFAWWGSNGRPPQWSLPEEPSAGSEWSDLELRTIRFPGHPQETTENAVDLAHLRYVHSYDNLKAVGSTTVDGALLVTRFDFRRRRRIAGIADLIYDVSTTTYVHGLGYSFVDIHERTIGLDTRLWVLATPVDGTFIDLVLVGQVRDIRKPKRLISGFGFLPLKLRTRVMNKILMAAQETDVLQDVAIWERKRYRPHPRLSRSDGAIGKYRRYCRQFYPYDDDGGGS